MADKPVHASARGGVPDCSCTIEASGRDPSSIGIKLNRRYDVTMSLALDEFATGFMVDHTDICVGASDGKSVAGRAEGDTRDPTRILNRKLRSMFPLCNDGHEMAPGQQVRVTRER